MSALDDIRDYAEKHPCRNRDAHRQCVRQDRDRLLNALEAVRDLTEGRAQQLRSTSDRLNQQVMSRHPDRDCSAAIRYDAYAAEAETTAARVREAIKTALEAS